MPRRNKRITVSEAPLGKKKTAASTKDSSKTAAPAPSSRSLLGLVALGVASSLWAAFLWSQLLVQRAGGQAFCGFSDSASCGSLWDGAFASAVHAATKIPVAGWGLMWGLVATALPLWALYKRSEGETSPALVTATKLTAIAGALSVVGLLVVSLTQGGLCMLCVGTYILTTAYALVALVGWRALGFAELPKAVQLSTSAVLVAFLVLLYPGSSTPRDAEAATADAIRAAAQGSSSHSHGGHSHGGHNHGHGAPSGPPPAFGTGPGTGDASRDAEIERFVSSLPPEVKANLSSSLGLWHAAPAVVDRPAPRSIWGAPSAPTQIVEWTDILCGHCANMHATLEEIARVAPPNSFSVEPRHFPLDGACNPNIQRQNPNGPVSCVAAQVQICLEGDPRAHELSGELFQNQRALSVDKVWEIGSKYMPRDKLQACVESADTKRKLDEDIAFAMKLDPHGTPIVMINGKNGNGFGAFLYAMVMTNGTGVHPAFKGLPPPDMNAHIH